MFSPTFPAPHTLFCHYTKSEITESHTFPYALLIEAYNTILYTVQNKINGTGNTNEQDTYRTTNFGSSWHRNGR
ncbi:hypothetical protein CGJ12_19995 [Vibrio parahaemolyticus]|nr:hypothetical protein CGJ62_14725 [Vibrio parahaemolyticus]TOD77703.1 hypothetical protein CGJ57_08160 [Vibrio parahaemolyticus]TOF79631.1 hypothetical protein CGJ14_18085 [Vibrio parahaemolyticus]TOF89007.1 hypothetical protein CGJ12_19995 [Vibrio parahaemolyticus]TOI07758.1 hypothetical protein CGI69_02440 [Vibrio parahaemolyticus]